MNFIRAIFLSIFFTLTAIGQTWLTPKPNTTYPANQSIYYQTTNLFLNSFFLGGTNGANGYFIWNGTRINSPADFAVAVSNSVAPTSLVYLVDFVVYTNSVNFEFSSVSNRITTETTNRIATDTAISNSLTYVATNAIIKYIDSPTNSIYWSFSNKTWYFSVCLTNVQNGFGGTNIIYVTNNFNPVTAITNLFQFDTSITNNNIITNLNNVTNTFLPTTILTNIFQPTTTNNISISNYVNVADVLVTNFIYNTTTNDISISNYIDAVTVNVTNILGDTIITNNSLINITNIQGTIEITNIINTINTNNIIITNIAPVTVTNNIYDSITNIFTVTNIQGNITLTNIVTTTLTNNFTPVNNQTNLTQINFYNPVTTGTNTGISVTNNVVVEDPLNVGNIITQEWIFINGLRTQ